MSFWLGFSLILIFFVAGTSAIWFIMKKIKGQKEEYIFRTEEGEEVPIGI